MSANVLKQTELTNSYDSRLAIAHNALVKHTFSKPTYFIEDATIAGDKVNVCYINENDLELAYEGDEDVWCDAVIDISQLQAFALTHFANANRFDGFNGEHFEYGSDINASEFVTENLNIAVKAYIEAGKELKAV